jgi:hypothetical protein
MTPMTDTVTERKAWQTGDLKLPTNLDVERKGVHTLERGIGVFVAPSHKTKTKTPDA